MDMKQLDLNVKKCGTLIFGKKKNVGKLKKQIEEANLLTIKGEPVTIKMEEKYLGDFHHCQGLSK